eukprot:1851919-Prymnesium_polylepis.1
MGNVFVSPASVGTVEANSPSSIRNCWCGGRGVPATAGRDSAARSGWCGTAAGPAGIAASRAQSSSLCSTSQPHAEHIDASANHLFCARTRGVLQKCTWPYRRCCSGAIQSSASGRRTPGEVVRVGPLGVWHRQVVGRAVEQPFAAERRRRIIARK